jgi:hypothetical protein
MRSAFRRITGFALILASIAGLLFSLAGIVGIWQVKRNLTGSLNETVGLLDTTLKTTTDGLIVVDSSLTKAIVDVNSLGRTLQATGRAIHDTNPLVEEISTLVSDDLPDTLLATQTALISAQSSARLIESTLRIISNIPLLPLDPYEPPVPLETALGEVVTSLESLPDSLSEVEKSLNTSQGNLVMIEAEFNIMSRHITDINTSLSDAQFVIGQYQGVVSDLHQQIKVLQTNLPAWINTGAWFLTFALIWLALTQLGLLSQGLEMVERPEEVRVVEVEPAEPD